ncbi:winged helix DNA-binding domain-containing protein [Agromyces laixinhei]|uniref:winged helix DNA-binding domain-containing protein n=1 Tax=Agromyces laixinhei TaxID=2585717 RepID=UPI0012EE4315|nr:winged helix DNA-binding domain-containing protein [Agromyces laixinhei]
MDLAALRRLRLRVQGLRHPFDASAPEVVRRFVAVQAQEFLPAQWGLAARVPEDGRPDAASVAAALDRGDILRTHVLRPTWHFLHPADARWVMELSAERVHRANGTMYRRTGVEGETATRALDLVAGSLAGGHRTRAELSSALEAGGMPFTGLAFGYVLMLAELERVAISGANVGRQRTYAAFDERVPAAAVRPRDEALAELAARFIASRGPVSARDFSVWSGFTLRDARKAFTDAAEPAGAHGSRIEQVDVDGEPHLLDAEVADAASARSNDGEPDAAGPRGTVDLLQAYDEYIMGYAAPRAYLQPPGRADPVQPEFPLHAMMVGGVMCGRWAPVVQAKRATVRIVPWRSFSRAEERSLAASVTQVERFLGVPVTVEREAPTA